MESPDFLSPIVNLIKPYDPFDLLSKIGAMQLCPENAHNAVRLEALAHAINCLKYEPDKPIISRHRLAHICNEPPLGKSHIQSQEDPTPNAFTEAFTFFGGSYIVFPGQVMESTFIVKQLNTSIFQGEKFTRHEYFQNRIYGLTRSVLEISNEIAVRANLSRNMAPGPISRSIFVPPGIDKLQKAVVFSLHELEEKFDALDLDYSFIEPFIQPFGELQPDSFSMENSPLYARPIIQFEDNLFVSEPSMLLPSLRHNIILTAKEFGILDLLYEGFLAEIIHSVGSSLHRMGHNQIPFSIKHPDLEIDIRESVWSLDTDKILYAAVIPDTFTDYVGNEVFEDHNDINVGEILDKHLIVIEEELNKEATNLGEILYLLIHVGIGRSQIVGMRLDGLRQEPIVLGLSASDLETISSLYFSDELVLYKFAKAQQSIRKTAQVVAWSTLDEFVIYRKNDYSFYLDDGPRPNLITIAPGSECELKVEALQKLDIHAVPMFESTGWIEVANAYNVRSCPIYTPLDINDRQIGMFVELSPVPFWILAKNQENQSENLLNDPNPAIFVDLISYWIWQFENDLSRSLEGIHLDYPILLEVVTDITEERDKNIKDPLNGPPITIKIISDSKMQIIIKPAITEVLNTADNTGELQIIRLVFEGFCELLKTYWWIEQAGKLLAQIPQFLEEQKINPRKKKIMTINPSNTPTMLPGNPISFREVQKADISDLLDETGKYLQEELHLVEGIIPKEQHVVILNSIVLFYFNKLTAIIGNLSPEHLLDFLVTYYEAIVSERTNRRITIATQLACFSSVQELEQQLNEQVPEIDTAALSCRFLIEYVVTQPPTGNNPMSMVVYDQMMALASEIISRGNQSDFAKYELFDFVFEVLPSGRLGSNRSQFDSRIDTYQSARSNAVIFDAIDDFPRWWKEKAILAPDDYPPHVKELNLAFKAEFGLVFTDISRFISELGDLSLSMKSSQLKMMEFDTLVEKMSNVLEWSSERILSIINFLSLSPREKFLDPPHPFLGTDIYPWRMSRGLSYLRRPLLFVEKDGQTIVCWGVRHLFAALDYLLQATVSGRLQDNFRTKEMRDFLGKIHTSAGENFNHKVYQAITGLPDVIVDEKVNKVHGNRIGFPGNDLGDLDILAFFPKSRTIAIIECKDLEIARNAIEMSREVEALFSGNPHKESTITKHLRRVEWVRRNLTMVLESYGVRGGKKWKIEPLLVVSSEMITPHFHSSPIKVFSFRRFKAEYLEKLK